MYCGLAGFCAIIGLLTAGSRTMPSTPAQPLKALFLGNSYTRVNALPAIFQEIAVSAGYPKPEVASSTPGACTLSQHLNTPGSVELIDRGDWDVVVLQEQSQVPAWAAENEEFHRVFLSGAEGVVKRVREKNPDVKIVFYETWARAPVLWEKKSEQIKQAGCDAAEMQKRIREEYEKIASMAVKCMPPGTKGRVMLARVGDLWEQNFKSSKPLILHSKDGSHPAFAGSYLAGLVIFSNVYDVTPARVTYRGALAEEDAALLRKLTVDHRELVPCPVQK